MKTIPTFALVLSIALWTSCSAPATTQEQPKDGTQQDTTAIQAPEDDDAALAYACPMHPEVMGKQGDTCSKCGMDLEPVAHED